MQPAGYNNDTHSYSLQHRKVGSQEAKAYIVSQEVVSLLLIPLFATGRNFLLSLSRLILFSLSVTEALHLRLFCIKPKLCYAAHSVFLEKGKPLMWIRHCYLKSCTIFRNRSSMNGNVQKTFSHFRSWIISVEAIKVLLNPLHIFCYISLANHHHIMLNSQPMISLLCYVVGITLLPWYSLVLSASQSYIGIIIIINLSALNWIGTINT